jgi:hypothetical protein
VLQYVSFFYFCAMTLKTAFKHFLKSDTYKAGSKAKDSTGGKLRGYSTRFEQGKLGEKAMANLLKQYGYSEDWQPPK